jgi:type IV pilus assembly protein PilX
MNGSLSTAKSQNGAALLIALFVLVIVSVMGITAMKTSMFSAKIATGTQIDAMAFEGAESAITATYFEFVDNDDVMQTLLLGSKINRCITMSDQTVEGECQDGQTLDSRGLIVSESHSKVNGYAAIDGYQVGSSGGGAQLVEYKIGILGDSELPDLGVENHHMQEALKRALKPASDIE